MTPTPVVLIVSSHRDSLAMYAIGLLATGFEVVTAEHAEGGFVRACACRPDLIVADAGLSDASGLDFARRLREDVRTKDTRMIALTSDADASLTARAAGFDRSLMKPCDSEALAREIRQVLGLSGLPRAAPLGAAAVNGTWPGASHTQACDPSYREAFDRLRGNFNEMPGMRLTTKQVRRLCGVDDAVCVQVLEDLVRICFLRVGPQGQYMRATDGRATEPRTDGVDDTARTTSPISRRATG